MPLRRLAGATAALICLLTIASCASPAVTARPDASPTKTPALITDDRVADDSLAVLGVYEVHGTKVVDAIDPKDEAVWHRFTELVDVTKWPQITLFVALDRDASPGGTDGAIDRVAGTDDDYYVAFDVTGADSAAELDATMIHEFGHLVTLNSDQLPPDTGSSCDMFTYDDRCAREGSYFRAWVEQFWPGYTNADRDSEPDTAVGDRFATGDFVSEYAATNPYEDLAETFSAWVRQKSEPTGESVLDEKLRFFDAYPEVVALKEHARAAL